MGGIQADEISNKLKLAMKKKLEELNVPPDKELPEYILCMIANGNKQNEMKDKLTLFLGSATPKFVEWLFDVVDQLSNSGGSSKMNVTSKPVPERRMDVPVHRENKRKSESPDRKPTRTNEREKARDREREKEKEREREKEKEKEREKQLEAERKEREERKRKEREREREKRFEDRRALELSKNRPRRSRSRSASEDSYDSASEGIKKVPSSVVASKAMARSPEAKKVSSQVIVKRKPRAGAGEKEAKSSSQMFMRALTEASASASAGYGANTANKAKKAVEQPKQTILNRLTVPPGKSIVVDSEEEENDPGLVVEKNSKAKAGPRITVTLKGGKDLLPSLNKKMATKRKIVNDSGAPMEKKKNEFKSDINTRISPTFRTWDGKINVGDDDTLEEDDEAEIDAVLASTRTVMDDEVLPPTFQLSGRVSYQGQPFYPPGSQPNQKETDNAAKPPERCKFWPNCRQGDSCIYAHPTKPCTNFPNCTFGNRCLYIHPPCRFGFNCTKIGCIFTHGGKVMGPMPSAPVASKKPTPIATSTPNDTEIAPDVPLVPAPSDAPQLNSFTPCRFGAGCTKVGCTFKHPQPCRYGSGCYNHSCYFYHPPGATSTAATSVTSTFAKYKWKADGASTAVPDVEAKGELKTDMQSATQAV